MKNRCLWDQKNLYVHLVYFAMKFVTTLQVLFQTSSKNTLHNKKSQYCEYVAAQDVRLLSVCLQCGHMYTFYNTVVGTIYCQNYTNIYISYYVVLFPTILYFLCLLQWHDLQNWQRTRLKTFHFLAHLVKKILVSMQLFVRRQFEKNQCENIPTFYELQQLCMNSVWKWMVLNVISHWKSCHAE